MGLIHYSPIYTILLTSVGIQVKLNPDTCKRTNVGWKPGYITHLRMWVESGLGTKRVLVDSDQD